MKKVFVLVLLLVIGFAYVNRERLYLRDPLGSVSRNGIRENGAQVFINASNDVLLENDNAPMYLNLLQSGQPVSAPETLKCIHYVACLLETAPQQRFALPKARIDSMTAKQVRFHDSEGREVEVKLR